LSKLRGLQVAVGPVPLTFQPDPQRLTTLDAVSIFRHNGAIMRKTAKHKPWERIGVSRATWYRHGRPTKKPKPHKTVAEIAREVDAPSLRTYQRTMRVLHSELKPFVSARLLSIAQADRLLSDPEHLRRFLEMVEQHKPKQEAEA
jgi:hypothetical protein